MRATDLTSKYNSRPIVYVDMDGCLADFFGEVARAHNVDYWREIHRQDLAIDKVAQEPGFFANLPIMPHAAQLMMGILSIAGSYCILSSPLMSDVDSSAEDKASWLEQHLTKHPPTAILFDHEKYRYARQANGTPNILIDDFKVNIKLWESHGGIGILHKDEDWQDSIKKLAKALAGYIAPNQCNIDECGEIFNNKNVGKLYTNKQVLKYVQGIHHEYELAKPILKHKCWILKNVPIRQLMNPEYVHQDDPYRRVIDLDWDHIEEITTEDIVSRPAVADENGWLLDGNHRVTAARARGLEYIPVLVPCNK